MYVRPVMARPPDYRTPNKSLTTPSRKLPLAGRRGCCGATSVAGACCDAARPPGRRKGPFNQPVRPRSGAACNRSAAWRRRHADQQSRRALYADAAPARGARAAGHRGARRIRGNRRGPRRVRARASSRALCCSTLAERLANRRRAPARRRTIRTIRCQALRTYRSARRRCLSRGPSSAPSLSKTNEKGAFPAYSAAHQIRLKRRDPSVKLSPQSLKTMCSHVETST